MHPNNIAGNRRHHKTSGAGRRRLGYALTVVALNLMVCLASLPSRLAAETITATWNGGEGAWIDSANWNINRVPANSGGDVFRVLVDSGRAGVSTVHLDTHGTAVDSLTISDDDSVEVSGGLFIWEDLRITRGLLSATAGGYVGVGGITNTFGTIRAGDGSTVELWGPWVNGGMLETAGSGVMFGNMGTYIAERIGGLANVTNKGTLQVESVNFTGTYSSNAGIIENHDEHGYVHFITWSPDAGTSLANTGIIRATNGGWLTLFGYDDDGAGIHNDGGILRADDGALMRIEGLEVGGGTFQTEGSGVIIGYNEIAPGLILHGVTNEGTFQTKYTHVTSSTTNTGILENDNLEGGIARYDGSRRSFLSIDHPYSDTPQTFINSGLVRVRGGYDMELMTGFGGGNIDNADGVIEAGDGSTMWINGHLGLTTTGGILRTEGTGVIIGTGYEYEHQPAVFRGVENAGTFRSIFSRFERSTKNTGTVENDDEGYHASGISTLHIGDTFFNEGMVRARNGGHFELIGAGETASHIDNWFGILKAEQGSTLVLDSVRIAQGTVEAMTDAQIQLRSGKGDGLMIRGSTLHTQGTGVIVGNSDFSGLLVLSQVTNAGKLLVGDILVEDGSINAGVIENLPGRTNPTPLGVPRILVRDDFSNAGTIRARETGLTIDGSAASPGMPARLDNSSGVIEATDGSIVLYGLTITGGTFRTGGDNSEIAAVGAMTFAGHVTNEGRLSLYARDTVISGQVVNRGELYARPYFNLPAAIKFSAGSTLANAGRVAAVDSSSIDLGDATVANLPDYRLEGGVWQAGRQVTDTARTDASKIVLPGTGISVNAAELILAGDGATIAFQGGQTLSSSPLYNEAAGSLSFLSGQKFHSPGLVNHGRVHIDSVSSVDIAGFGMACGAFVITACYAQNAGVSFIDGTLTAPLVLLRGGRLQGSGLINGDTFVEGEAEIWPGNSAGTLTVAGDFNLESGLLELETENGAKDLIIIGGNGLIGSGARIRLLFDELTTDPIVLEDFFELDSGGMLTFDDGFGASNFSVFSGDAKDLGVVALVSFGGNSVEVPVSIAAIPEPAPFILFASGLAWIALARRRLLVSG